MLTTTVDQLLLSLQLSDSAFPSGLYTMSHGLEGFDQARLVAAADVGPLLAQLLLHSVGPGDATAFARAHDAATMGDWAEVERIDWLLFASKLGASMRSASVRSGRQIAGIAGEVFGVEKLADYGMRIAAREAPGCQPIVSAICYAGAGVQARQAIASDLFAFSASFVGAAVRLRLVDHRAAQVVLRGAAPVIEEVADAALRRPIDDLGGYVPLADIASARHERSDGRLFAS